jgi:hypothetical protein
MATATRNFFEQASPAKKAGVKKTASEAAVEGLEMVASIKVVRDNLDTIEEFYTGQVKVFMHEYFVASGCAAKKRPDNFTGMEGDAEASCQLKKRSSLSKLSELDIAMCEENNIPLVSVPSTFAFNAKYCDMNVPENVKRFERINKALSKIEGLESDLFVVEQSKVLADEASIDAVFGKSREIASVLLPAVAVLGIRPKLKASTEAFIQRAFDRVAKALGQELRVSPEDKKARNAKLPAFARTKPKFKNAE